MRLIASMIVRDELARYLPLAVDHLLTFCDEIRVLDDWSIDGTYEWLQEHPGPIEVKRNPESAFYVYESHARQALLEWTMEGSPDYVLSIDADEFVGNPQLLRNVMNRRAPVYTLVMDEVWNADEHLHIRIDGLWGSRLCPILWRAPSQLTGDWKIPDRQLACGREPTIVRRTKFVRSGSSVYHFGWTRKAERTQRAERYFEHDRGRFHKDQHLSSILWPDERVRLNAVSWPRGLEPVRERLLELIGR